METALTLNAITADTTASEPIIDATVPPMSALSVCRTIADVATEIANDLSHAVACVSSTRINARVNALLGHERGYDRRIMQAADTLPARQ